MAGGLDLGTLRGKIVLDGKEAEASLQSVQDKTEQTTRSAEELGNSMADTGATIAGIGAAGLVALGGLVKVGADLSAEIAGQQFLFKNLDKTVQESITTNSKLAEEIGLTEQQYLNASTKMATYYKNMGFTSDETSKLSGDTMNLVADLAAVTDMPFDEAMDRFKSGLMGNYEALDAFGVNVSAASLENSEYVKGLGKTWNQLSDNEKMMAVYNEVQRQGASANGLAKQEAEGFGMQLKLVKQMVTELAGKIGMTLIPIIEPLLQKFKAVVEKVTEWVEQNGELVGKILAVVGVASGLLTVVGSVMFVVGKLTAFFGGLGLGMTAIVPIIAAVVGALVYLIGTNDELRFKIEQFLHGFIYKMSEAFTQLLDKLPEWFNLGLSMLQNLIFGIAQAVPNVLTMIFNLLHNLLGTIAGNLPMWIEKGKELLLSMIQGLKEKAPSMINSIFNMLLQVLNLIGTHMPAFLRKGVEIIAKIAKGVKDNLPEIISKFMEMLRSLIQVIIERLPDFLKKGAEVVGKLIKGLIDCLPDLLSAGGDLLSGVIDGIKEGLSGLLSIGGDIVDFLLQGIKDAWGGITDWVGSKLSNLNPFGKKKSIEVEGEMTGLPEGQGLNPMARLGGHSSLNPALLGASLSRSFKEAIPRTSNSGSNLSNGMNEVKETVIETVVNLDGKQIARASARYMESELEALTNKSTRLGGKVWA